MWPADIEVHLTRPHPLASGGRAPHLRGVAISLPTRTRRRVPNLPRSLLAVFALGSLCACEYPLGLGRAWIDGEWIYEAQTPAGPTRCELTGLALRLEQDGEIFSGVVAGGELLCEVRADSVLTSYTTPLDGAPITAGEIRGKRITFQLGARGIVHQGRVDGRSMTGTVTIPADVGATSVDTLSGSFAAARSASPDE